MGNNPSRSSSSNQQASGSTPTSPHGAPHLLPHHATAFANLIPTASSSASVRGGPRRRESIQALSTGAKSSAAPPSASLESATARPVHVRSRSQTTVPTASATVAQQHQQLLPAPAPVSQADRDTMGGEQSKLKRGRRERGRSISGPPDAASATDASSSHPAGATRPMDVPTAVEGGSSRLDTTSGVVAATDDGMEPPTRQYPQPSSTQYSRPPRLPLPIEEELYTPGSPIVSPAEIVSPILHDPSDLEAGSPAMPRRTSVLSSTTAADEDEEELAAQDGVLPAVPTVVEWRDKGEKVYVTGTFAGWDRKYRLSRDGPSKHGDALSTTINLQPGTHHLRFIVDGEMRLSDRLPTAVDFTNYLVNYVEVSPDDVPPSATATGPVDDSSLKPHLQRPAQPADPSAVRPGAPAAAAPAERKPVVELRAPPGVYPPQILPPTPELRPVSPSAAHAIPGVPAAAPAPPTQYHRAVPAFLTDLDEPEDSAAYGRANMATNHMPPLPSLPGFLGKSILNGATPAKDDASVLGNPNHTVLNHLATSSIRNKVIATSATTRYKRKFLTTILYKPTTDTGE